MIIQFKARSLIMGLIDNFNGLSQKKKIAISAVAAIIVIGVIVSIIVVNNSGIFATSMRLLRAEGTVNIEDSKGNIKPASSNMRFQSGDILSTSYDGIASIGLDDNKIVTLEGYSRAAFSKKGKQIEMSLITGGLYFEVKQQLDEDEKFEIKTANMTVGIRGTSGYLFYDQTGLQSLIVTDGVVTVEAVNSTSGQKKSVEVHGGQKLSVYLYEMAAGSTNSIKFVISDITPKDLPDHPLRVLSTNKTLLNKICQYTGWDASEVEYYINKLPGMNGNPTPTPVLVTQTVTPLPTPTPDPEPTAAPVTPGASPTVTPVPESNGNDDRRTNANTPTPVPRATNTPTPKPGGNGWGTPRPTETPTPTPSPSPSPSPIPTVEPEPSPSVAPEPSPTDSTDPTDDTEPSGNSDPDPNDTGNPDEPGNGDNAN